MILKIYFVKSLVEHITGEKVENPWLTLTGIYIVTVWYLIVYNLILINEYFGVITINYKQLYWQVMKRKNTVKSCKYSILYYTIPYYTIKNITIHIKMICTYKVNHNLRSIYSWLKSRGFNDFVLIQWLWLSNTSWPKKLFFSFSFLYFFIGTCFLK